MQLAMSVIASVVLAADSNVGGMHTYVSCSMLNVKLTLMVDIFDRNTPHGHGHGHGIFIKTYCWQHVRPVIDQNLNRVDM